MSQKLSRRSVIGLFASIAGVDPKDLTGAAGEILEQVAVPLAKSASKPFLGVAGAMDAVLKLKTQYIKSPESVTEDVLQNAAGSLVTSLGRVFKVLNTTDTDALAAKVAVYDSIIKQHNTGVFKETAKMVLARTDSASPAAIELANEFLQNTPAGEEYTRGRRFFIELIGKDRPLCEQLETPVRALSDGLSSKLREKNLVPEMMQDLKHVLGMMEPDPQFELVNGKLTLNKSDTTIHDLAKVFRECEGDFSKFILKVTENRMGSVVFDGEDLRMMFDKKIVTSSRKFTAEMNDRIGNLAETFSKPREPDKNSKASMAEDTWADYVHDARKDDPTAYPPHPAAVWRGDYY